ncbi:DUF2274 domain-containing protein [Hirschia litorea]|uniref:DUF2274 domain-containing protein n=1 Tax=Hirschia litorea TaxID=1199156 RepID=A0ABW2IPV4_9PROT
MPLRLEKLPDRTPVRMSISLEPDLALALKDYAHLYQQSYGNDEKPETLIPAMLDTFLKSDLGFKRARKKLHSTSQPQGY